MVFLTGVRAPKHQIKKASSIARRVVAILNREACDHEKFIFTNAPRGDYVLNFVTKSKGSNVNKIGQLSLKVALHEHGHRIGLNHCYLFRRKWRGKLLHDRQTIMAGDANGRLRFNAGLLYLKGWYNFNEVVVANSKEFTGTVSNLNNRYGKKEGIYCFVIPYEIWKPEEFESLNKPSAIISYELSKDSITLYALYGNGTRRVRNISDYYLYNRFNIEIQVIEKVEDKITFKVKCLNK